jgi:hypothetical protein
MAIVGDPDYKLGAKLKEALNKTGARAMTDMPELKPCPFCKGEAQFEQIGTARQSMIISCADCGCRHESGDVLGLTEPLSWNSRADLMPQWRPISEAPVDNSLIIAYDPRDRCPKIVYYDFAEESPGWRLMGSCAALLSFIPTHWMPLPEPPKGDE